MNYWLIPSNNSFFRLDDLLEKREVISWRQVQKFEVGDVIYIYSSKPFSCIKYQMDVVGANLSFSRYIDDEEYNADKLAKDIAMSRASLYKKMQTILGITPTDFIRNVRLKRAAQLLADTQLTINEIAGRVGFVTPRNFSSQFKKMFGVTPSEYREPQ